MLSIVLAPDPRLRTTSRLVRDDEFGADLDAVMDQMIRTLQSERGAGLAGVQVGDLRSIILVCVGEGRQPEKMVNPVITKASQALRLDSEGCLSFPGRTVQKNRPRRVTVEYRTPFGEARSLTLDGFDARCVLHEIDHLSGKTIL